ncbi:hypothetical protein PG993_012454 [Apiospora rasikravindrae]|uniref:Uncharacterized protein n=1 Tax=Apiospora rasikravindrae TaxID=990691 RepID=A0ABR1S2M1_9PEZI
MRTKAPAIREVFNIQARGDAECLSASPRPVQRILPAPVPTLGRPSPSSDLVSNGKSPNPPTAINVNQGIPDQIDRRATQSPSVVAPQPQARRQNHVLDRETSFGQGPQKTGAQSQSPLFGSFGSLFNRQDSHSQPPRPPKNSPRASPLPSEINNFSGFGLHPNRNDRNTGLGRSQSPNPELLRRQQEAKPRTQPVGGSAQANNVQGSNTQSNGVSHTAAKFPEPAPSSSTQPTANSRSFNLKLPGDEFLHFGGPSRVHHYSATPPQVQPAAQTAAQRALTYSAAFSSNGDVIKKSSSSSPQLPPAAVAPPSNGLRAPVAPMIEGQNGHKTHIEPLEVISIDSSSDDDSSKRRTGFPRPNPPQASSAQQVQKVRQTQQDKQPVTNGLAVVNQVPTKVATNGTTASVVSGDKTSDSDRPLMDRRKPITSLEAAVKLSRETTSESWRPFGNHPNPSPVPGVVTNGSASKTSDSGRPLMDRRKPITGPKTVANGFGGSASGPERPQVVRRETGSVPGLDGNVSGNKSSDSDRPIMERWRVGVAQKAVSTRTDAKRLDSDRLVGGPARDPNVVPDPAPARAPSPDPALVISEPAAANKSGDKTSDSDRPLLAPDRRWTNVTRQRCEQLSPAQRREMLVDTHDGDKFDSVIYSKANESSRPNSVIFGIPPHALQATASSRPMPQVPAHFNPWTHWTHARTPEWHAQKQVEIRDRGYRKDPRNFGQVAKRLAQGKATRSRLPSYQKQELPDRVKTNPAWMSALAELDKLKEAYHADQRTKAQQRKKRTKGKGKARLLDDDGDVEMDSPGSGSDKDPAQQRPTEFVLFRGDWTSTK